MGMLKVFAGLFAFLAGAGSIAGMILNGDMGLAYDQFLEGDVPHALLHYCVVVLSY